MVPTVARLDRRRRRPPASFMRRLGGGQIATRLRPTRTARAAAPHAPLICSRQPPSRLRLATSGAPRAYTDASPAGFSLSVGGSNTDTGFRFLTDWHKLRAGALLCVTLSQAPPRVGTHCNLARPAATAPARQLHANVRKRMRRRAMAQSTDCARGSAPRSPHPVAPAAISPAAGDSGGAPRLHRCQPQRLFTISTRFPHCHWIPLTNAPA